VIILSCQVEVSASGRSLIQRSPTECGVSEWDREASIMRKRWPTTGYYARKKSISGIIHSFIHSFSILSDDRSKASSKTIPPHSAIESFLLQMRVSSPVLKVIQ